MKNLPASPRPRLICRIARPFNTVTGGGARHLETCTDCQAYFAAAETLERTLRRDAPAWSAATTPAPSTGFEQRLLHAVRPPAAPKRSRVAHLGWMAATALTAAIAVALFRPAGSPADKATAADAALLAEAVSQVSRGLVERMIPTTGALVADNPLQREFGAIRSDARSALRFLAMNFLPAPAADADPAAPARPI
ncbi:MAG: hypothetical protein JNK23_10840 [Opitutaceae bacterium]|nr:hypothetical protein [Opitutaceae bacterium]